MGWFSKKEKEGKKEIPPLPELPKLPEFPKTKEERINDSPIHQLPSLPTNLLGEKFSQNTIKKAITGKKEGEEVFEASDFVREDKMRMMQKPLKKPLRKGETKNLLSKRTEEVPEEFKEAAKIVKRAEPIFIRIDKFEESLHIFEKAKKQILEIEKMLKDIKKIKEEEERELESWENKIQATKEQIEKIDNDIFSKIE